MKFIYDLYTKHLYRYLIIFENHRYITHFHELLGNMILFQGKHHVYDICMISITQNKIRIYIKDNNIVDMLKFKKFISYRYLKHRLYILNSILT